MSRLTANMEQTSDATREAMQAAAITLKQTDGALKAAEAAMINVNGVVDQDSPTFYEFRRSMREVSTAARTLRLLSDSIESNPRALIFGKPETRRADEKFRCRRVRCILASRLRRLFRQARPIEVLHFVGALPPLAPEAAKSPLHRRESPWNRADDLAWISRSPRSSFGLRRTKSILRKTTAGRNRWKKIFLACFHKMSQRFSAPNGLMPIRGPSIKSRFIKWKSRCFDSRPIRPKRCNCRRAGRCEIRQKRLAAISRNATVAAGQPLHGRFGGGAQRSLGRS